MYGKTEAGVGLSVLDFRDKCSETGAMMRRLL